MNLVIVYNKSRKILKLGKECVSIKDVKKTVSSECFPDLSNFELSLNGKDFLNGSLGDCGVVNGDKLHVMDAVESSTTTETTAVLNLLEQSFTQLYYNLQKNTPPPSNLPPTITSSNFPPSTTTNPSNPSPPPKPLKALMIMLNAVFLSDENINTKGFFLKQQQEGNKDTDNNTDNNVDILTYSHKHFANKNCTFEFLFVPMSSHSVVVHGFLREGDATIQNDNFFFKDKKPASLTFQQIKESFQLDDWKNLNVLFRNHLILPLLQAARRYYKLPLLPSISSLPNEILLKIIYNFKHFKPVVRLSEVNSEWRDMVWDNENIWSHFLWINLASEVRGDSRSYETFKREYTEIREQGEQKEREEIKSRQMRDYYRRILEQERDRGFPSYDIHPSVKHIFMRK